MTGLAIAFEKTLKLFLKATWQGLKYLPYKSIYFYVNLANCITAALLFAHRPPLFIVNYLANHQWPLWIQRFYGLSEFTNLRILFYLSLVFIFYPFILGIAVLLRLLPFQKKLDYLKLGIDESRPKVVKVIKDADSKTILRIRSASTGVEKFQGRKSDLQAAFNQSIESIVADENNPQYIEIVLSTFPLPKLLRFDDHAHHLQQEGQLVIGQSRQGIIVQKIADLPHLLIAGTSGSGKSTFFKQALLGLMQSSPKAQFYLIDLKRGAEFRFFEKVPGVKFAKTVQPAVALLKAAKTEMMARFEYIESKGITKIDPETENLPRIIIAIDEASEILAIPARSNPDKDDIIEARILVNDIAKLGRAAAVHLIVATQKVSKTIIDTSLQENMGGRMAFRMATLANSAQVLGSKDAREIPAIEGRGRYQFGTKSLDIQAPFLTDEQLKNKLKSVSIIRAQFIESKDVVTDKKITPVLTDQNQSEVHVKIPDTEVRK